MKVTARKRDQRIYFHVSEQEAQMISAKMVEFGTKNREAYLRKMALNGYIVKMDLSCLSELIRLLRNSTNNLNQIARRANETRSIYVSDLEDIQKRYDELWKATHDVLNELAALNL